MIHVDTHLQLLDVEDGGLVLGQQQHDVLAGEEPLEAHLRLQIAPEHARVVLLLKGRDGKQDSVVVDVCKLVSSWRSLIFIWNITRNR